MFALAASRAPAQPKPDLTAEIKDVFIDLGATVDQGDVTEGCATAATGVDLLRFTAITHNVGDADLLLGEPQCPDCATYPGEVCGNPLFHCSPASGHGHAHYSNYALYELVDGANQVVATSGKRGFCIEDAPCPAGITPVYNCDYQGITAGCADAYIYSLGCQYIDVTAVAGGSYTLRVTADPFGEIDEADEANNAATFPLALTRPPEPDAEIPGRRAELTAAPAFSRAAPSERFAFRASGETAVPLPSPASAPTAVGATLVVFDTGDGPASFVFELPAAGWRALGNPPGSKGYRFRGGGLPVDPDAIAARECRSVRLKPSGITANCRVVAAPWTPIAGDLAIRLTTGDGGKRYCARFGGTEIQNDGAAFKRTYAPSGPCAASPY